MKEERPAFGRVAERAVASVVVNARQAASCEEGAALVLADSLAGRSSRTRRPRASAVDTAACVAAAAYEAEEAASYTAAGGGMGVAIAVSPGSGVEVEARSIAAGDHILHTDDGAATAAWVVGIHDSLVADLARGMAMERCEAYPAAACWGS